MSDNYEKVKEFILELVFRIDEEIPEEEIVIVNDEDRGVRNLVIDCERRATWWAGEAFLQSGCDCVYAPFVDFDGHSA